MFEKNTYILATETVGGITKYYVSFIDGEGKNQETEVSYPVYLEFYRFAKKERNLKRWTERHIEQSKLSCGTLNKRAFCKPKTVDELIFEKFFDEQFQQFIESLPEIQRRRFTLSYEFDLTLTQIAEMEGCSIRAVGYSIKIAYEKIKKFFEELDFKFTC